MFNFSDYVFHLTSELYDYTADIEGTVCPIVINAAQIGSVVGFVLLSNCYQALQPPLKTPKSTVLRRLEHTLKIINKQQICMLHEAVCNLQEGCPKRT